MSSDPDVRWEVPFAPPEIGPEEQAAARQALASGWLAMGPRTRAFEEAFAAAAGVAEAVAVSSGTAALHLALHALDLRPGDEVVVPALTFVATPSAVVAAGGRPVLADIASLDDPCLSAASVERCLGPRSRAILAVHYAGMPCEMAPLRELARAHRLRLIEDAAHAPGALLDGKPVGGLGDAACFSFFANKNLTTIEGGMITSDDRTLAERLRRLRSHGLAAFSWERHLGASPDRDVEEPGFNYRLDDVRAALGLAQLPKLAARNARRGAIVAAYREALAGTGFEIPFLSTRPGRQSAFHLAPLLVGSGEQRLGLARELESQRIQTSHHYIPVHHLSYYREAPGRLPVTEAFAERELTLPLHSALSDQQLERVCQAILRFTRGR